MGRRPIHKYMVIFLVLNHYGYVLIGQKMTPKNPRFDDLYRILDPGCRKRIEMLRRLGPC